MSMNVIGKLDNTVIDAMGIMQKQDNDISIDMGEYVLKLLDIDVGHLCDEKKTILRDNFIHLMCLVISDLRTIDNRLVSYKKRRNDIEADKSNGAEYKRRKLDYFSKQNKKALNDIVHFLNNGVAGYLEEEDQRTLDIEFRDDELGKLFLKRRYLFAQFPEYYDVDFDYSTIVKAAYLPDVQLEDSFRVEKKYLQLKKSDEENYYVTIKKIICNKDIIGTVQKAVDTNYHLHRRHEIFDDLVSLYRERHYQSFLSLGLIQLEGLFYDICSIIYGEKENAGTLVEKAEKALRAGNNIGFMRYYPYFAFDVPILRNEIAHTGMINSVDLERKADELILDLNAVVQMAKMESDGKFRVFLMIFDKIKPINNPIDREINKKLVHELFASNAVAPDSFWTLLKKPEDYKDELAFYKKEDELQEGYADLPTIVEMISAMVRELPFWCEMFDLMSHIISKENKGIVIENWKKLLLKLSHDYVGILSGDAKKKCTEILAVLQNEG